MAMPYNMLSTELISSRFSETVDLHFGTFPSLALISQNECAITSETHWGFFAKGLDRSIVNVFALSFIFLCYADMVIHTCTSSCSSRFTSCKPPMSSQQTCGTSTTVSRSAEGLLWPRAHWKAEKAAWSSPQSVWQHKAPRSVTAP